MIRAEPKDKTPIRNTKLPLAVTKIWPEVMGLPQFDVSPLNMCERLPHRTTDEPLSIGELHDVKHTNSALGILNTDPAS